MNDFKILVVDDNYEKVELIGKVTNDNFDCVIEYSNTTREALEKLQNTAYDLIIVDMNLPQIIGDTPSPRNGYEFIRNIFRNQKLKKPLYIIGATSHKDAYTENLEGLASYGVPLLLVDTSTSDLRDLVSQKISYYQVVKQNLTKVSNVVAASQDIQYPSKVTFGWLINNVDYKHWIVAVLLLFSVFTAGVKSSELSLVKEIFLASKNSNEN